MHIPSFFYSDASFERGHDTPTEFLPAIQQKGFKQACLIDHNTTTSTIRFLDSANAVGVGAIVGMTASVTCKERDHALWRLRNHHACMRLLEMIGVVGEGAKENAMGTYTGIKQVESAFLDNSLKSAVGKKRFVAACTEVIGPQAERIIDDNILQPFKRLLKYIDKALPLGELIFIAKTEVGYKNILALNSALGKHKSEAVKRGENIPLALTKADIEKYSQDVIVIDGLHNNSYSHPFIATQKKVDTLPLYSSITAYGFPLYASESERTFLKAQKEKLVVPFPQFRYAREEDYDAYCVKVAVQKKENVNSFLFEKPPKDSLLVEHDDVVNYYSGQQELVGNALQLHYWESLGDTPVTLGEIHLPNYDMPIQRVVQFAYERMEQSPPDFENDDDALRAFEALIDSERPEDAPVATYRQRRLNDFCLLDLTYEGLERRLKQNFGEEAGLHREKYQAQVEREFEVIKEMGFSGYFLIEYDMVNFARQEGVAVGPGRGSAAGSLLVYCIEITDVDPIMYDLKFERFLNPERVSMPDIDTDFGEGREKVLRYISEKYQLPGAIWPSSSQIANMNRYQLKSSIAAVRGAYELSMIYDNELKRLVKTAENELGIVAPRNLTWDEFLGLDFVKKRMNKEPMLSKVLLMAKKLTGKMQSYGVHAGGVVISPTIIPDYAAVWSDDEGNFFSLYDKDDIERAGLIKFDILGLRTLNITTECVSQIKENHSVSIDLRTIDFADPAVYNMICQQILCDVFQLNSQGMRQLVGNLQPQNIEELAVLSALFRPGALQSGMVEEYIDVKNGVKPPHYDHPALEPVTSITFGCIVFQEQVMGIVRELAGYSLGGADLLRRAMGKKKMAEMAKQRDIYAQKALTFWRENYLELGKKQGFDFPLDVNFKDCTTELETLGIADSISDEGYISGREQFLKVMKTLLKLDKKGDDILVGRISDYNYVVKYFKSHYQSALELSITNTLSHTGKAKEMYMRLYFSLSQYVRFNQVFNKVEKFAGYGFNKSHAVAYAIVTYMSAWLKVYYPSEFYASAMTFKKKDELYETVVEASQKLGIKVAPPHVNSSRTRFLAETEKRVRYG
ncbi:DNA polymerase III subunit alpha, partial [Alteromonas sp. 14N.309.X.WAT.G.H12]|uniref:DNA polymerase III subunit alpha n=1 Tax=Alteromonas sp. 14N.309.X.WAT.G.H12 TaxID=3120824 RepID=UPI002FD144CE